MKHLYQEHVQVLTTRLQEMFEKVGMEHILIYSGEEKIRFLDDKTYPFLPNPHFVHFVPLLMNTMSFIHLKKGESKPTLYYYQKEDFWNKPASSPAGFWVDANVLNIKVIDDVEKVRTDMGNDLSTTLFIGEITDKVKNWNFKLVNDENYIKHAHLIRTEKTSYEQECLRKATKRAVKAHQHVMNLFRHEKEVSELSLNFEFQRLLQSPEVTQPYNNIIAFNEAAAILHYVDYRTELFPRQKRHSLLVDAGAEFNGYVADITRTYSLEPHDEFQDLVNAVEKMKLNLIKEFKLGVAYTENHIKAHHGIAQILKDFDFIRDMTVEAMVETKVSHKFFPHGLGHFLGIQTHDVGGSKSNPPMDHPYLRCTQELNPGHVFTVEPGLYFVDMLLRDLKKSPENQHVNWDKVNSFRKFGGIRVEDNVIVHSDRFENITRDAYAQL